MCELEAEDVVRLYLLPLLRHSSDVALRRRPSRVLAASLAFPLLAGLLEPSGATDRQRGLFVRRTEMGCPLLCLLSRGWLVRLVTHCGSVHGSMYQILSNKNTGNR